MSELSGVPWPPESPGSPGSSELIGPRLTLRPPTSHDRGDVIALLTSAEARRYLGGPLTPSDAVAATADPPGRKPGSFVIAETIGQAFVGVVGFKRRDAAAPAHLTPAGDELELWYQLTPSQWGRGFGTEATTLALQWAASVMADDVVVASTQAANERSLRMLRGLGFREHTRFVEYDADQVLLVRALDQLDP